jgi:hypothetical protein
MIDLNVNLRNKKLEAFKSPSLNNIEPVVKNIRPFIPPSLDDAIPVNSNIRLSLDVNKEDNITKSILTSSNIISKKALINKNTPTSDFIPLKNNPPPIKKKVPIASNKPISEAVKRKLVFEEEDEPNKRQKTWKSVYADKKEELLAIKKEQFYLQKGEQWNVARKAFEDEYKACAEAYNYLNKNKEKFGDNMPKKFAEFCKQIEKEFKIACDKMKALQRHINKEMIPFNAKYYGVMDNLETDYKCSNYDYDIVEEFKKVWENFEEENKGDVDLLKGMGF